MYDGLYSSALPNVQVLFHGDHPSLNAYLSRAFADSSVKLDVISTHSKYVPSQKDHLLPLENLIPKHIQDSLNKKAMQLCTIDGHLYSIPRNIDTRLLWYRSDVVKTPPMSFQQILDQKIQFGFTGTGSGVFGLFYELVLNAQGSLFDAKRKPTMDSPICVEAIQMIVKLADNAKVDLAEWKYVGCVIVLQWGFFGCLTMCLRAQQQKQKSG